MTIPNNIHIDIEIATIPDTTERVFWKITYHTPNSPKKTIQNTSSSEFYAKEDALSAIRSILP